METAREYFFDHYDEFFSEVFWPHDKFTKIGAQAIPKETKKILDVGIGTGKFSYEVSKLYPHILITGIDNDPRMLNKAREKLNGAKLILGDFYSESLPKSDWTITSMFTHHFREYERKSNLLKIVNSAERGLINFDMQLRDGETQNDAIKLILNHTRQNFPEEKLEQIMYALKERGMNMSLEKTREFLLEQIEYEMNQNDNIIPLSQTREIFSPPLFNLEMLAQAPPYFVYKATHLNKNP